MSSVYDMAQDHILFMECFSGNLLYNLAINILELSVFYCGWCECL